MNAVVPPPVRPPIRTVADLLRRLGDVPPARVRFTPTPGTATPADIDVPGNRLCEIVDGTLVEKAVGQRESFLAGWIITLFNMHVIPRNLGYVTAPDGFLQLASGNLRAPDVAYFAWESFPDRRRPAEAYPAVAPDLAVEVLSPGNTRAEMAAKRAEFFASGTRLIWEIDPRTRTARAFTAAETFADLTAADALDAAPVLPGFVVPLADLFAQLDRHG